MLPKRRLDSRLMAFSSFSRSYITPASISVDATSLNVNRVASRTSFWKGDASASSRSSHRYSSSQPRSAGPSNTPTWVYSKPPSRAVKRSPWPERVMASSFHSQPLFRYWSSRPVWSITLYNGTSCGSLPAGRLPVSSRACSCCGLRASGSSKGSRLVPEKWDSASSRPLLKYCW